MSAKRYRYTGMERDDETGLAYHSARHYAPWLGLWTATDPLGIGADISRWRYTENPIALADPSGFAPPSAAELQALREDVETTRREAIATAKQLLHEAREELRSAESMLASLHDSPIELREKAAAHYRNAEINYAAAMDRLDLVKQVGFLPWDQVGQLQTVKFLALEQQRSISEDAALLAANYDPTEDARENRRQFWHEVAEGTAEQFGITDAAELVEAGEVFVENPDWGTAANLGEKAVPVVAMAVGPKVKGPKTKVPKGKAPNNARAIPKRKAADDGHSFAYEPARDNIPTIEREWQAWDINDARSRSGCEDVASQIKDHIGGKIFRI
ncbi:MAG: RHS repeat-associated core domain-containing protein [Candidatus Competibacteraceae bacterium]|nr:RHS repeat-associated core domain-containing protein [Candidatus Competibacteraceae bacterium]